MGVNPAQVNGEHFTAVMISAFPGINTDVLRSAFQDLYLQGLTNTDKQIFGTMTYGSGVQIIEGRLSEHGKKFIAFCSLS